MTTEREIAAALLDASMPVMGGSRAAALRTVEQAVRDIVALARGTAGERASVDAPLPGIDEPYASMTRAQLAEEVCRFAENYNRLERSRDCLRRQVREYERLVGQMQTIQCSEDHEADQ